MTSKSKLKPMNELDFYKSEVKRLEKENVTLKNRTYAAPHVWNMVAKEIRQQWSMERANSKAKITRNNTLADLALSFAKRFTEDEGFDPLAFLDRCSPDTDLYPLSELWNK